MKPFQRDPCAACGCYLIEHDGDRKDVRCGEHINRSRPKEPPPTTEWRRASNVVCTTCYFVTGAAVGALLTLALVWFR